MDLGGVSYEQVEWCLFGGRRWPGVLCVLGKREPCVPVVLLRSTEDSQILLKGLVGSFAGSVSLRVVRRTDVLMDVQEAAEVCGEFRREAYISI